MNKTRSFFCLSFCPLRMLYNSKLILMAASLGTNAVGGTRIHCMLVQAFVKLWFDWKPMHTFSVAATTKLLPVHFKFNQHHVQYELSVIMNKNVSMTYLGFYSIILHILVWFPASDTKLPEIKLNLEPPGKMNAYINIVYSNTLMHW